jgi:hypothetical protein
VPILKRSARAIRGANRIIVAAAISLLGTPFRMNVCDPRSCKHSGQNAFWNPCAPAYWVLYPASDRSRRNAAARSPDPGMGVLALCWAWIIWASRKPREIAENPKAKHDSGEQMLDGAWRRVWAQMTDEDLEDRLFTYFRRAMNTPNSHSHGLRELVDEAERRGLAAMAERVKLRAANIPAALTCSDDEIDSAG